MNLEERIKKLEKENEENLKLYEKEKKMVVELKEKIYLNNAVINELKKCLKGKGD